VSKLHGFVSALAALARTICFEARIKRGAET
jgi:hypothetical protein